MKDPIIDLKFTTIQEEVPDFVYKSLKKYIVRCNTYYPQPLFLRNSLSRVFNLPSSDWVLLTNGVDEALRISLEAFGKNAHLFTPTEYTTAFQFCPYLTTHYSLIDDRYQIDTSLINGATFFVLANPNNPVGYTHKASIVELLKNNPQAIVAIDEIYGEYAPKLSVVDLLPKFNNLIIFRGFSKSYGLAGIRLGYILGKPDLVKKLMEKTTWSNVSYLSCGIGQIALEHKEYYAKLRLTILKRKKGLTKLLEKRKLKIIPSLINTITLKFPSVKDATQFVQYLAEKRISVNQGEGGGKVGNDDTLVGFVVGTSAQTDSLRKALF
ncbi:histidinol-phosphate aminotransferase family protein [Candidatus Roizmanbacteria bacterium]|nr:histidinol-phosphate aminotransferase family protein [Candidatus Roizmanbacteria bacterium]